MHDEHPDRREGRQWEDRRDDGFDEGGGQTPLRPVPGGVPAPRQGPTYQPGYGEHPDPHYAHPHDPRFDPRYDDPRWDRRYLSGWVRQVGIVAVLLMVLGLLEMFFGLYQLATYKDSIQEMLKSPIQDPNVRQMFQQLANDGTLETIYLVTGLGTLLCGLLKLAAGFQNRRFRSRLLGFLALSSGVLTSCSCCGLPFALMVYGLIVYFNGDVARAFELAAQGYTPEQIRDMSR